MGTPNFAVASLQKIVESGGNVVAVITAPDKPAGRGMKLQQSAVKEYALAKNLHILQPEKLRNKQFLQALKALNADIQVVVAFRMLPEVVWKMPSIGTLNVHGSLLPQYRGAAPINRAVMNGETATGVTTFLLKQEIDTGDILLQRKIMIGADENAGSLYDRMKIEGAELLIETLAALAKNNLTPQPQNIPESEVKHAPKIFTEDCKIDANAPAKTVNNLIRGLSPYPGAFTFLDGKKLKIFEASVGEEANNAAPGTFQSDNKTFLKMACRDKWLHIANLQLEGKKRMSVADFLRGYKLSQA